MSTLKSGTRIRRDVLAPGGLRGAYATVVSHVRSGPSSSVYKVHVDGEVGTRMWNTDYFHVEAEPPVAVPDDSNPKDAVAQLKVDLSLIPDVFSVHVADALMDGAKKYGPFNWRDKKVQARVYVAAAKRHLAAWFANEETAEDSGVHHLGHAAACLAIILDAQHHECLLDNRPANNGKRMQDLFDQINQRRAPNHIA